MEYDGKNHLNRYMNIFIYFVSQFKYSIAITLIKCLITAPAVLSSKHNYFSLLSAHFNIKLPKKSHFFLIYNRTLSCKTKTMFTTGLLSRFRMIKFSQNKIQIDQFRSNIR